MLKKELKLIVTFYTSSEAMATENACKVAGIDGKLISAPRNLTADCGISYATDISNSTNENTTAISKEEKEGSSFKTLEISLKLITYLNSLKNLTTIEKEQLRGIFQNIYNLIVDDPEKKLNSSDSEMIDKFTDEV